MGKQSRGAMAWHPCGWYRVATFPVFAVGRQPHPAFLLQELEKDQSSQQLFHIIAVVFRLFPNQIEELEILLLVSPKEILVQTLHRECLRDIRQIHRAIFLLVNQFQQAVGGSSARFVCT